MPIGDGRHTWTPHARLSGRQLTCGGRKPGAPEPRTIDVAPDAHDDVAERRPIMRCAIAYPLMAYRQSVGGA
jgi:hypothetical protein